MREAIPPLNKYAFMTCYSVKKAQGLYLLLLFLLLNRPVTGDSKTIKGK
jgi:hypothetical protein